MKGAIRPEEQQPHHPKDTGNPTSRGSSAHDHPATEALTTPCTQFLPAETPESSYSHPCQCAAELQPVLRRVTEAGRLGKWSWAHKKQRPKGRLPCLQGSPDAASTAKGLGLQGTANP